MKREANIINLKMIIKINEKIKFLFFFIYFIILINLISNVNTNSYTYKEKNSFSNYITSNNYNKISRKHPHKRNLIKNQKNLYSNYKKQLKKKNKKIKKIIKNKANRGQIEKCGIDFLKEIYCQFYKKNYNEDINNCRKLKTSDFENNCTNIHSIYSIFYVKSALKIHSDLSSSGVHFTEDESRRMYKSLLKKLNLPFRYCNEIPLQIKLNFMKAISRFIYNENQIEKLSKKRRTKYNKSLSRIKTFFTLLTTDLNSIDLEEKKIRCIGLDYAANTIVKYFGDIKTLKRKKEL
jgi:hypothetical protein